MSRKTNTVEWFPHYANASSKMTLTILEKKYGINGYAAWFKLLECLAQTEGHYIPCQSEVHKDYLMAKLPVSNGNLITMLQDMADLSAIDKELWDTCKVIWSDHFIQGIKEVYANRGRDLPNKPTTQSLLSPKLSSTYLREEEKELEEGIRGREEKELEDSSHDPTDELFEYWNIKKIVIHEKITTKQKTKIRNALKDYEYESIKKAIDNYDNVMKHPETYFFSYKWTLEDFMARGLNKFMDNAEPLTNFLKDKAKQQPRQPLKSSEDIAKENEEYLNRGKANV